MTVTFWRTSLDRLGSCLAKALSWLSSSLREDTSTKKEELC